MKLPPHEVRHEHMSASSVGEIGVPETAAARLF